MNYGEAREILGVGPDNTDDEIKRAYLRLTRKHRPETDPEGFHQVRRAYEILSGEDLTSFFDDDSDDTSSPRFHTPASEAASEPKPLLYNDEPLILRIKGNPDNPRPQWEDMLLALAHPQPAPELLTAAMELYQHLLRQSLVPEADKLYQVLDLIVTGEKTKETWDTPLDSAWELVQEIQFLRSFLTPKVLSAALSFRFTGGNQARDLLQALKETGRPDLLTLQSIVDGPSYKGRGLKQVLSKAVALALNDINRGEESRKAEQTPPPRDPFDFDLETLTRPLVNELENLFDKLFGGKN